MITQDTYSGGIALFYGPLKVAVVNTHQDTGVVVRGVPQLEMMPRSSWTVHFTSPAMSLELLEAILAAVPRS
jgi:hypothetical protein